jgi:hypothetical protein
MTVRVSDPNPEPEEVQEGAVAHVLRDDVEWLLLRAHRVHRHQVWVRELLHDFRLLQPTRQRSTYGGAQKCRSADLYSRVSDPNRIQSDQWIRIQEGRNDPHKYKKV